MGVLLLIPPSSVETNHFTPFKHEEPDHREHKKERALE